MDSAVERAISYIWEEYGQPLSLDDLAQSAILSKFYFCRMFGHATGVSPRRFLSAVRIYQAKRMLLSTSMHVTDISFAVGYNSLGSFTNRFTDSVGVSPGKFRRLSNNGGFGPPCPQSDQSYHSATIEGRILIPKGYSAASVYVGAFDTAIVQHCPAAAMVTIGSLGQPHEYRLEGVPAGRWFIHAVAVADSAHPEPWTRRALLVGDEGPVRTADAAGTHATILLRPRNPADLPILLALPELEPALDEFDEPQAQAPADASSTGAGQLSAHLAR
jgi:AraC-like DNA-binding protein